ncbi:MAG: transposase [Deltaproteobacteria bacterium]|nr:transposase [Deltaproteobacteria bacterium]
MRALSAHVLHCDDTGICVLDRDHPGFRRGHLWNLPRRRGGRSTTTRRTGRKAGPVRFLAERRGWLVADRYAGFDGSSSARRCARRAAGPMRAGTLWERARIGRRPRFARVAMDAGAFRGGATRLG